MTVYMSTLTDYKLIRALETRHLTASNTRIGRNKINSLFDDTQRILRSCMNDRNSFKTINQGIVGL